MMDEGVEQSCILTGDLLARLRLALRGLELNDQRMRDNLDLTGGMISAEAVMLALGATVGRQRAHEISTRRYAQRTGPGARFADVRSEEPRVRDHLDEQAISGLLDPSSHVGLSPIWPGTPQNAPATAQHSSPSQHRSFITLDLNGGLGPEPVVTVRSDAPFEPAFLSYCQRLRVTLICPSQAARSGPPATDDTF